MAAGTPAGINIVFKKDIFDIPLQASFGYFDDTFYGVELGYSFYKNLDSAFRSVQIITGVTKIEEDHDDDYLLIEKEPTSWKYVGLSTTFQYRGLFIEPGLTMGEGSYSNPQVSLQFGWLWGL